MIFRTDRSIYEVREDAQVFRRLHGPDVAGAPVLGRWLRFERASCPEVGEPMRFFWLSERGSVTRLEIWTTGPVREVLDEPPAAVRRAVARRRA